MSWYEDAQKNGKGTVNITVPCTPDLSDRDLVAFAKELHKIRCARDLADPTDWDRSSPEYQAHFIVLARALLTTPLPKG